VLRESAQVKGDVDVIGKLDHLEVTNHTRMLDEMKNDPFTADDYRVLQGLEG
jgi:hypothetical protein